MDDNAPFHPNGMVVMKDDIITHIGPFNPEKVKGQVVDMSNKVLVPGFINTHTHSHSPLFRGIADDLSLMDWLKDYMWPAEKHIQAKDAYHAAKLSCLELIESGVTTFADQYYYASEVKKAVLESGLRAYIAPSVFSWPSPESDNPFLTAKAFIENTIKDPHPRIIPCIGPHAIYSCDDQTIKAINELAKKHDLIVHIHIAETQDEVDESLEKHGLRPVAYLKKTGLLARKTLSAHTIHVDQSDIDILKEFDVKISYNPISNLKLVSGIMPFKALKNQGLDISLAMDGVQSNNAFNLLSDLKTGVLIQKMHEHDPTFIPALEALKLITIDAAKCLFAEDKIGSLEIGKQADLIAFDLDDTNLTPVFKDHFSMVTSALVYSAQPSNITDVMVGGGFLYRNQKHRTLDAQAVKTACRKSSRSILEAIQFFDKPN